MRALVVALICFSAGQALAQSAPLTRSKKFDACISNAALDAASNTCTITAGGNYAKAVAFFSLTRAAATAIAAVPWCSNDNGTTYSRFISRSIAAGVGTGSLYSDSLAIAVTGTWFWEYDIRGCDNFRLVVTDTAGGATDYITVDIVAVTGD